MNKLLMALGVIAMVGAGAGMAAMPDGHPGFREGYGGAPPMTMADALSREMAPLGGSFGFIADECRQTLDQAAQFAAEQGWTRLADFKKPDLVGLLAAYLSMKMEKSLTGDMVTAFERGPEGLLILTSGGCVTGIMGGLKPAIDKALADFRANGPAA